MDIIYLMRQRKDDKVKTLQMLTMVSQLGLVMLVSVGMTTALGIWLDKRLGTCFITVIMFFLGAAAGASAIYRMVKRIYGEDENERPS